MQIIDWFLGMHVHLWW